MPHYFSYAEQSAHYFARADEGPRLQALTSAAAWEGRALANDPSWRVVLSAAQIEEIDRALAQANSLAKPTGELLAEDFPLPSLASEVARWRTEIEAGRGFLVVKGLPVERWSRADSERVFWCLGLHMGRPGAQNPQGDLLGHVTDTGDSTKDPFVRLYRTSAEIAYHCDAADVVGLLCLRPAPTGGASRIVSSVTVYNELLAQHPELTPRLYEPFLLDIRNEDASGALRYLPIPPCRYADGRLRTFFHSDYFRSVQRHEDVPPFSPRDRLVLDRYEQIASSPELFLDMELEAGDIQWLSNHSILHARTAYEDDPHPERKRHLLRLWLSIEP